MLCLLSLTACSVLDPKPTPPLKQTTVTPLQATLSPCLKDFQQQGPIKYGYGEGENLQQAKQQAYRDIAEQLGVRVDSSNRSIRKKIDAKVSSEFSSEINTHASADLSALKVNCLRRHGSLLTINLSYDTRPLPHQVAEHFIEQWLAQPTSIDVQGPKALTDTPFINDLKQELLQNNPQGGTHKTLKITIENTNGWRLNINNQRWPLRKQQLHYVTRWAALNKTGVTLSAKDEQGRSLPSLLYAGTEFRLHSLTTQPGYLQLIGFYDDGSIDIVRQDIHHTDNSPHQRQIPQRGIFEASTLNNSQKSRDVYMALLTNKPLAHYPALLQLLTDTITGNDFNHLLNTIEQSTLAADVLMLTIMQTP